MGGIRIMTSPSQDRSTVNDAIASPNESRSESMQDDEHKEGLVQGCSSCGTTFALVGFAGNADTSLFI